MTPAEYASRLAWIPSVINAFVVTDLALSFKPNPKLRVEHLAPITLALAVISFLIYRRWFSARLP
jgi:hypothetical protein